MSSYHDVVCGVHNSVDNFFKSNFSNIHIRGPYLDASKIQKRPLMVISTHRSHIDYILIGILLHKMGFKNLRFAAGDNLTGLPVIGPWFKSLGAFTVERDNGFERNYVRNLCRNVITMLENREPVIVFPEGGRSYSGKAMEIKSGVLGAAILCQAKNLSDDVNLLIASISYEFPPDLPWFGLLQKGKSLRRRSNNIFKRIIGNGYYFGADIMAFLPMLFSRYTGKKFGDVYVDFKETVSVRSIVDIEKNHIPNARDEFSAHRVSMQKAGEVIHKNFLSLFCTLPIHIVAVLIKGKLKVSINQISENVPSLLHFLSSENRNIEMLKKVSATQLVESGISQLLKLNAITINNDIIYIKNNDIINYFAAVIGENWR
ncbi:MAG TPA: 1-acyl-sn-glycerol-3-phosphate acyltransferase [Chitinispirillaceae bacterium]|nr:1-acyl-sn-glycerol-3-phosphate acyltransferase [Chitinispirillaceae bacterium]